MIMANNKNHRPHSTVFQPESSAGNDEEDDWRMFPMDKLYCEGKMKPVFRGYIHAAALASLLPFVFYEMWEDIDKWIEYYALVILVGGTIICWGTSTLFHCLLWQPEQEIFIQRIVAAPNHFHFPLFFILCNMVIVWSFGVFGVWHVFHRRGQRLKYWIFMIVLTFPSYPILAAYMTLHERCLFLLVLFINLVGAGIFGTKLRFLNENRYYRRIAPVFGYHEIFHVLTVLGCISLYYVLDSLNHNILQERCDIQQSLSQSSIVLRGWKDLMVFLRITSLVDVCSPP